MSGSTGPEEDQGPKDTVDRDRSMQLPLQFLSRSRVPGRHGSPPFWKEGIVVHRLEVPLRPAAEAEQVDSRGSKIGTNCPLLCRNMLVREE